MATGEEILLNFLATQIISCTILGVKRQIGFFLSTQEEVSIDMQAIEDARDVCDLLGESSYSSNIDSYLSNPCTFLTGA
jgi:hypothetical protein